MNVEDFPGACVYSQDGCGPVFKVSFLGVKNARLGDMKCHCQFSLPKNTQGSEPLQSKKKMAPFLGQRRFWFFSAEGKAAAAFGVRRSAFRASVRRPAARTGPGGARATCRRPATATRASAGEPTAGGMEGLTNRGGRVFVFSSNCSSCALKNRLVSLMFVWLGVIWVCVMLFGSCFMYSCWCFLCPSVVLLLSFLFRVCLGTPGVVDVGLIWFVWCWFGLV